jgi:hypothetical protein
VVGLTIGADCGVELPLYLHLRGVGIALRQDLLATDIAQNPAGNPQGLIHGKLVAALLALAPFHRPRAFSWHHGDSTYLNLNVGELRV